MDIAEWFSVTFDDDEVTLDVRPPDKEAWRAEFRWKDIVRVCFKAEGPFCSDGIYVFVSTRPQSYAVPTEAEGGADFWGELIRRKLFDVELAIKAACATEGLFCWPPEPGQKGSRK